MSKRKTTDQFVKESKLFHDNNYDYSMVEYKSRYSKVKIICRKHGIFEQAPFAHIKGQGCPECAKINRPISNILNTNKNRYNLLEQPDDYKLIPLTKGKFAKVDNDDFDKLKDHNWYISNGYVCNRRIGRIHRFIMNCNKDMVVDHKNHDTLDNRKSNLRICTNQNNVINARKRKKNVTSIYKGVSWANDRHKWRANICFNGKISRLGSFDNEIEAAKAYDAKAKELFGEFAKTNF